MKTAALAATLVLAACAHRPPAMDIPASLAAAESAFAAHSVREDMRAAFLAAFTDDGVIVRNGWTVSNNFFANRPAPPILLEWRPQYVEVAASGELGLSTGPSRITSKQKPDTPPVSESLDQAEADFQRLLAAGGARAAYEARGARDLRLFRNGAAPAAVAALSSPPLPDHALGWTVEKSVTASSGDFGYTRGAYAALAAPANALGWYLRVWRREAAGWRVFVDVVNPAPKT